VGDLWSKCKMLTGRSSGRGGRPICGSVACSPAMDNKFLATRSFPGDV